MGGLENRRRLIAFPGFESLTHRHFLLESISPEKKISLVHNRDQFFKYVLISALVFLFLRLFYNDAVINWTDLLAPASLPCLCFRRSLADV